MKHKNIFYFSHINSVGGVESFFYYLCKKYKDIDIVIYYKTGDQLQIDRLKKYIRCIQYTGQRITCDKAFFNYNPDIIDNVTANEYIQVIHADYKAQSNLQKHVHPKMTKYIGVSELACKNFTEVTGKPCELCYNPIVIDKPKRVLKLISATRLTAEKGRPRMIKLAQLLDNAGIPYIWTIFTNDTNGIPNPNVIYMEPRLDISNYIAGCDYLVQLSDCEAFCYSVVEALMLGVPVIVTKCPVFDEIGLDETNSFKLNFDMSDVPIKDIYEKTLKFKYTPPADTWDKILAPGKNTWLEDKNKLVTVTCIRQNGYDDLMQMKHIKHGESFQCTLERADHLRNLGYVK